MSRSVLAALLAAVLAGGCGDVGGPVPGKPAHHRERGFANPVAAHTPATCDHLDVATVRRLAADHRPRFLVPLGLKTWFAHLGITDVEEMDW